MLKNPTKLSHKTRRGKKKQLSGQGKINTKEILLINGTNTGHLGTNS